MKTAPAWLRFGPAYRNEFLAIASALILDSYSCMATEGRGWAA